MGTGRGVTQENAKKEQREGSSLFTVLVALAANGLLAAAKTVAAMMTGSASMAAEAAHSWSDTGNEVFLLLANRRGQRPRDDKHPRGYGRVTYIWSLVAAFGLFFAGSVVSIWHGVTSLLSSGDGQESFTVNYVILGIALILEGGSFIQASRQVHNKARTNRLHPVRFVTHTSDSTLRAVFFEDFSALLGILFAGAGIGLHQLTGQRAYDAAGSIAVGLLLGVVAVFLMRRNMQYLLGEGLSTPMYQEVLRILLDHPEIDRITYLHVEYVGPSRLFVVAAVDLVGDDSEPHLALRFRRVEQDIERSELIEDAILTPAPPDEPALSVSSALPQGVAAGD